MFGFLSQTLCFDRYGFFLNIIPSFIIVTGHLVHMPSHIYMRTGEYALAAESNRRAIAVDRLNVNTCMADITDPLCAPIYAGYYNAHNMLFLVVAHTLARQRDKAVAVAKELMKIVPHFVRNGQSRLARYLTALVLTYERFHMWAEILAMDLPSAPVPVTMASTSRNVRGSSAVVGGGGSSSSSPAVLNVNQYLSASLHHWARCKAYIGLKDLQKARSEEVYFKKYADVLTSRVKTSFAADLVTMARLDLQAVFAYHMVPPDYTAAIEALTTAVALQDTFRYDEPVAWMPVRVKLGAMYLLSGQGEVALNTFREDLYGVERVSPVLGAIGGAATVGSVPMLDQRVTPNNLLSLFGVYQSLKALKRPFASEQFAFESAWVRSGADGDMPVDVSVLVL